MRVTVCQLRSEPGLFQQDWEALAAHARREASDLVLLPEMPFAPWFAATRPFEQAVWQKAVAAHEKRLAKMDALAPALVAGTRPVEREGRRVNEAFVWSRENGCRPAHEKYYLPDEPGFWEASWYQAGNGGFSPVDLGGCRAGFLICTEMWFFERARQYGKQGVPLILSPRATPGSSVDKWLAGGRSAAVVAGAYCLSSNGFGGGGDYPLGGLGWVADPEGEVLAVTSEGEPFATVEINLARADEAKRTYPRYVPG